MPAKFGNQGDLVEEKPLFLNQGEAVGDSRSDYDYLPPLPPISEAQLAEDKTPWSQRPALTVLAPRDAEGIGGIPRIPTLGEPDSRLRAASEFAQSAQETLGGGVESLTTPEATRTLPLFAIPYVGPALAAVLGVKMASGGLGEVITGAEVHDPRIAGSGLGKVILSAPLLARAGLPRDLPFSREQARFEAARDITPRAPVQLPERFVERGPARPEDVLPPQPPPPIQTGVPNALYPETEKPVRTLQQPAGEIEGASQMPANVTSEEAGARSGAIANAPEGQVSLTDPVGNALDFYSLPRLRALDLSKDPRIARAKQYYGAKTIPDLARLAKARFEQMQAAAKPPTNVQMLADSWRTAEKTWRRAMRQGTPSERADAADARIEAEGLFRDAAAEAGLSQAEFDRLSAYARETETPSPTREQSEMQRVQALPEGPEGEAQLVAEDIANAVNAIDTADIAGFSPVPALVRLIRRAARDPAMKTAAEQAMQKIGDAARAQGVPLDTIKNEIAGELKAIYGADAAEMATHYFGESPKKSGALTPEEQAAAQRQLEEEVPTAQPEEALDRNFRNILGELNSATGSLSALATFQKRIDRALREEQITAEQHEYLTDRLSERLKSVPEKTPAKPMEAPQPKATVEPPAPISDWQRTSRGRDIYKADIALENAKDEAVISAMKSAPSYPQLLAAYNRFKRSLYGKSYDPSVIEKTPWEMLDASSGVMNAKSVTAKTLARLENAVFAETGLPRKKPSQRFRGGTGVDWDKITAEVPAARAEEAPESLSGAKLNKAYKARFDALSDQERYDALSEMGYDADYDTGKIWMTDREGKRGYLGKDQLEDAKREFLRLTDPKAAPKPPKPPEPAKEAAPAPTEDQLRMAKSYIKNLNYEGRQLLADKLGLRQNANEKLLIRKFAERDAARQAAPATPAPVAEAKAQAEVPRVWYESFGDPTKQRIFGLMREVQGRIDAAAERERALRPPQGTIAAGAAGFDEFIKSESQAEFLRKIRNGSTPENAESSAKQWAREAVAIHNRKRPKDVNWQRWEGTADSAIERLRREFEDVVKSPPEIKSGGPVGFFPRRSEALGMGEPSMPPTVEDVRQQRFRDDKKYLRDLRRNPDNYMEFDADPIVDEIAEAAVELVANVKKRAEKRAGTYNSKEMEEGAIAVSRMMKGEATEADRLAANRLLDPTADAVAAEIEMEFTSLGFRDAMQLTPERVLDFAADYAGTAYGISKAEALRLLSKEHAETIAKLVREEAAKQYPDAAMKIGDEIRTLARDIEGREGQAHGPVSFFNRRSEAQGLSEPSMPPTVEDVRRQRARDVAPPPNEPPPVAMDASAKPTPEIARNAKDFNIWNKANSGQWSFYFGNLGATAKAAWEKMALTAFRIGENVKRDIIQNVAGPLQSLPREMRKRGGEVFFQVLDGKPISEIEAQWTGKPNGEAVIKAAQQVKGRLEEIRVTIRDAKRETYNGYLMGLDRATLSDLFDKNIGGTVDTSRYSKEQFADALTRNELPDNWGIADGSYVPHIFFGNWKVTAKIGDSPEFVTRARTPAEAKTRIYEYVKNNPEYAKAEWRVEPDTVVPADIVRLGDRRFWHLIGQMKDALNVSSAEIKQAQQGVIGRKASKQKWFGNLQQREGYKGYSQDYQQVMTAYLSGFHRWLELSKLQREVQPMIEEVRRDRPRAADALDSIMDHLWGKPSQSTVLFDAWLDRIPGVRDHVKPLALDRWSRNIRTIVPLLTLKTLRFAVVNRLQPLQGLYPLVGERILAQAKIRQHTPEGRALLDEAGVLFDPGQYGIETGVKGKVTELSERFSGERSNQELAFLAMYQHGIESGLPRAEAIKYAKLRGQLLTQFTPNAADTPPALRGPFTSILFQFKRFPIKQVELLTKMASERRFGGIARWLAVMAAMGGLSYFMRQFLLPSDKRERMRRSIVNQHGQAVADAVMYGLPGLVNADISGSLVLGDEPFGSNIYEKIGRQVTGPGVGLAYENIKAAFTEPRESTTATQKVVDTLRRFPTLRPIAELIALEQGDTDVRTPDGEAKYRKSVKDTIVNMGSFRSATEANMQHAVNAIVALKRESTELKNTAYVAATGNGDIQGALNAIEKFNERWPEVAISSKELTEYIKGRSKGAGKTDYERLSGRKFAPLLPAQP